MPLGPKFQQGLKGDPGRLKSLLNCRAIGEVAISPHWQGGLISMTIAIISRISAIIRRIIAITSMIIVCMNRIIAMISMIIVL